MPLPTRWSHLARHGLLGASLLGASASPAAASPCDEHAASSVALVLGLDLWPRARLIAGLEARRCLSDGSEAMMRLELGGGTPRLIAGVRARPFEGLDNTDDGADLLGFEAGAVLDFEARFGAHLAATYGVHYSYLAAQGFFPMTGTPRPERFSLVAGFAPWTAMASTSVAGRPLSADGRFVRPALASPLAATRSAEARAVRDHFVSSAQYEYSSVWTFLRLAAELAAVGAPEALIVAALDAADDEVRHAELCAEAAGGLELAPLPLAAARPRFTARSPQALAVLAVEAWSEGCLNEGAAAEEARLAAAEASGPAASMLTRIARDEAGHAELSWAVLSWLFATAPEVASGALAGLPGSHPRTTHQTDPALARHGVPSGAIIAAARAHAETTARSRLAALAA